MQDWSLTRVIIYGAIALTLTLPLQTSTRYLFIFLLAVTAVSFWRSPTIFRALLITFVLLIGAVYAYILLNEIGAVEEHRRIELIIRIIKAFSLVTILAEGLQGALFAATQTAPSHVAYLRWARRGILACLLCAMALTFFMFPTADTYFAASIDRVTGAGALWLTLAINVVAILPIAIFAIGNLKIYRSDDSGGDDAKYLKSICSDYLWYVNIPALIGSVMLFLFCLMLYTMQFPPDQVKVLISGGMSFLIFSAILIGNRIEYSHQSDARDRAREAQGLPPEAIEPDKGDLILGETSKVSGMVGCGERPS